MPQILNKDRNWQLKLVRLTLLAGLVLVLHSCYTPGNTLLLQNSKALPNYPKAAFEDYKIQVNDEVMFRLITSNENFASLIDAGNVASSQQSNSYRVYPDGTIDLPFMDSIPVAGLTFTQAARSIEKRFKDLIPDAEVNLTLANKSYTVIGEAGTGVFPVYKDKLTIYQALAQSGEILLSGDRRHVKILRETTEGPAIMEFDIRPTSVIDSKYYYIYPNDIIYVRKQTSSFYKVNNYGSFLGLIMSSVSLFINVFYYTKLTKSN